jgi:Flp pilus assembly protein CpaB
MSRAGKVLFLLGLLIAVVSGGAIYLLLTLSQPAPPEVSTVPLVIAFQNIAARSEIVPGHVGMAKWPSALPTPIGAYEHPNDVVGKLAAAPIAPGQAVLSQMLIDKGVVKETHSNAALILEKGTIAVAMPVTIKSNVAEAIQAGDRVDVIATFGAQEGAAATQRLLADVLIMQVGPWPNPNAKAQSAGGTAVVTLQLKEQESLVLIYAMDHASTLSLVLRPAGDHDLVTLEPVTFDYINQRYGFKLPR